MKISTQNFGEVVLLTSPALVGATESIGFKTDVFESKNGTEVRTPLKDKARQTLGFSSVVLRNEIAQHFNTQWGGIRKNWAVPLFQEAQFVGDVAPEIVADGEPVPEQTVIACRTDIYSFYEGGLALLKNKTEQILVEILSVSSDHIVIKNTVSIKLAKLYPVRLCFINGDISRQISGVHAQASITFIVIDEPEVLESEPNQFLGNDLCWFCLTYSGDGMDATLSQQQNMINNEVGVIFQNSDWDFARYSKQYRAIIKGQDELYAYRQFLFRRKGKYRPFWLPTYESNMRCKSTGFVSAVMLIESDQYKQLADQRKHIAIKSNGAWTAHTITASALVSGSTVQVTVSPALNKNASSIERISYLGLHRLDADSIDLHYQGAGNVEVTVPILEIGV
ncbi:hypothetical protein [Acinetobacter sp. YH16057]|uniref:hypothetical protein n=1 Tax=Acinetobacter sp. YH16057 TaxID=2601195 RepID=UPI0015D399A5|nr:hypothetical protein [Acinetobacter sp. YH16057]